jgi:hypothetical protein
MGEALGDLFTFFSLPITGLTSLILVIFVIYVFVVLVSMLLDAFLMIVKIAPESRL